jgi:hypothetical protein
MTSEKNLTQVMNFHSETDQVDQVQNYSQTCVQRQDEQAQTYILMDIKYKSAKTKFMKSFKQILMVD